MRDLIATVLRHDGYAFAIGHNHPSGDPTPTPSGADRDTTTRCRNAAEVAGLKFVSHLVLGEHDSWQEA